MANKKIIRYTLELSILIILGIVYYVYFHSPTATNYSGNWIQSSESAGDEINSMLWSGKTQHLITGCKASKDGGEIGLYRPGSNSWEYPDTGLDKRTIIDLCRVENDIWALYFSTKEAKGGLLISQDEGKSWSEVSPIDNSPDPRCMVSSKNGKTLLLGTVNQGVLRSTDGGQNWELSNKGLSNLKIQDLCLNPQRANQIIAGTLKGLHLSRDWGQNWEQITKGFPDNIAMVIDITADPLSDGLMFAIIRDQNGAGKIYRSKNSGKSWVETVSGLPADVQPRTVVFHPNLPGVIFIGTVFDGVYRSDNAGDLWSPMNSGLPIDTNYIIVHSLLFSEDSPALLYAGTDFKGSVWRYDAGK